MYKFKINDLVTRVDGRPFNDGSRVQFVSARAISFGTPGYGLGGAEVTHWNEEELKLVMRGKGNEGYAYV